MVIKLQCPGIPTQKTWTVTSLTQRQAAASGSERWAMEGQQLPSRYVRRLWPNHAKEKEVEEEQNKGIHSCGNAFSKQIHTNILSICLLVFSLHCANFIGKGCICFCLVCILYSAGIDYQRWWYLNTIHVILAFYT